jgi:hypothetical protein
MMEPIESAVTFPPGGGRERAGGARPMPKEGGMIALVEIRADPNYRVPCVAYSIGNGKAESIRWSKKARSSGLSF